MTKITRFALNHRRLVVLAWIVLTVVGGITASSATSGFSHSVATPGTPGSEANSHIAKRFGLDGNEQPAIAVLRLPAGQTMAMATGQAIAARTFAAANRAGHVGVADFATTHDPKLVSRDGRTTWALIDMPNPDIPLGTGVLQRLQPALRAAAPAGASVTLTGFEPLQSAGGGSGGGGGPSVLVETLIGALGALIILAFVYGSAIAVVPLLMALPSILTTFLLVLGLEQLVTVNNLVEYLVAFIGLGVAIDYSLLIVTRWREEREGGLDNEQAILAAATTAGHAVVLSGITVAVGLLSLLVLPVPFLRSIGAGSMLIPLVAIAAAVTLLPVTLAAWGPALDSKRIRRGSTTRSPSWERWGRFVVRRRWIAGIAGLAIMIALALPALSMNSGQASANALAAGGGPAADALHTLERDGVPSAVVFPVQILVHGGSTAAAQAASVARETPGVYTVLAPTTPAFRQGSDSLLSVVANAEGNTSAGRALIATLRTRLAAVPGGVEVGGNTAEVVDFNHAVYGNFPLMLTVLALLTFLLLARAFRSVVLALKAVILNLISLGASYGFLVLFWQEGHGSNLVYGVPAVGAIRNFIPIIVFAFLFGLSMDYEVFVLARIREEYDRTGSTSEAVIGALARTGRLVTCAALIIALSLLSLSVNPDIIVRLIATALAAGILLDVIVVRTLLVPALVALMGRWNWWMPSGLARVLRIAPSQAPTGTATEAPQAT
ncbi:MAG TPA: MMPL family transporter [Solirubrobacteraceae bacterium]|jgi:RND superfamily putative drug exporter|nr:MMPL family transporter [Solirubrobacteraceae bacterium]